MEKNNYWWVMAALPLGVSIPAGISAANPNIILILADDMGVCDISAFNENAKLRTKHLDAMCANGIRFTDAHSNSSVSSPSRYGILTGRYAFRTGLKSGTLDGLSGPLIEPDRATLAKMLDREGYSTACIGKWHLGWNWAYHDKPDSLPIEPIDIDFSKPIEEGPVTRGFDYFYGIAASLDMPPYVYVENDMTTASADSVVENRQGVVLQRGGPIGADFETADVLPNICRRTLKYIKEQENDDRPFFLYIPLTAPHTPVVPTESFRNKSGLSSYGDFVLMIDDMVGKIISQLKETGQYDNTIVIFTADNGCAPYAETQHMEKQGHLTGHKYRGSKSDLFEGGHRVPLIISWGDRYDGQTESGLISLTDFYATFAEMTGYAVPDNEAEDSYSMWPVLTGLGKSARTDMVQHSIDGDFAIRSGNWKLLFTPGSGGWSFPSKDAPEIAELPAVQLYNMEHDSGETANMLTENPEIVDRLTALMRRYLEEGRSTPGERQSNDLYEDEWKQIVSFMK